MPRCGGGPEANLGLANLQPGDLTDAPYQQMAAGAGPPVSFVRALLEAGPGLLARTGLRRLPNRLRCPPRHVSPVKPPNFSFWWLSGHETNHSFFLFFLHQG